MDNDTTQDSGAKAKATPRNTKTKKIIITAVVMLALLLVVGIILVTSGIFATPKAHELKNDDEVVGYLKDKYDDDSFKIVSKETNDGANKWKIQSDLGMFFYVEETLDEETNTYKASDNYIDTVISNSVYNFKSEHFTAVNTHENNTVRIYVDENSLLDVVNLPEDVRRDLVFLCMTITNAPAFKVIDEDTRKQTIINFEHKSHGSDETSNMFCNEGDNSFSKLFEK